VTEETLHQVLQEGNVQEFQCLPEDQINFKVKLRDKMPPLTILISPISQISQQMDQTDLQVCLSTTIREPTADNCDQIFINVSLLNINSDGVAEKNSFLV
jgi:hypothetical protein